MATATDTDNRVTIKSGGDRYKSDKIIGYTISEVRSELGNQMNIGPDVFPNIDGDRVDESYVLQPRDVVTFSRPGGVKGA